MNVRELINALLDKDMDAEIRLQTKDPNRPEVSGVVFHIDGLGESRLYPTIFFTDWRDETDRREVIK